MGLEYFASLAEQYDLLKTIYANKEEFAGLLVLVFALARAVVKLTPGDADDKAVDKAYGYVKTLFGLLRVKGPQVVVLQKAPDVTEPSKPAA